MREVAIKEIIKRLWIIPIDEWKQTDHSIYSTQIDNFRFALERVEETVHPDSPAVDQTYFRLKVFDGENLISTYTENIDTFYNAIKSRKELSMQLRNANQREASLKDLQEILDE